MRVMIYVDTSKHVDDVDYLKVFANGDAAYACSKRTTPKASRLSMRSLSEPHRPPRHHVHAADCGAGADLEFARALSARQSAPA